MGENAAATRLATEKTVKAPSAVSEGGLVAGPLATCQHAKVVSPEGLDLPGGARSSLGAWGRHGGVSMATMTPVVSTRQTDTAPMGKREDVEEGA